jgi:hypothetical protein
MRVLVVVVVAVDVGVCAWNTFAVVHWIDQG